MFFARAAAVAAVLLSAVACSTTAPASQGPTGTAQPTATTQPTATAGATPTGAASQTAPGSPVSSPTAPGGSIDPGQSDAGVIAQVTLANDTAGDRDGDYVVVGVAADGSDCSYTFEGDEYIAVAWADDAPDGQIYRLGVSVPADAIPDADGTTDDLDARVSFDFKSPSGLGTLYYGDSSEENGGHTTVDIIRTGEALRFDFDGVSYNGATFQGTMMCADGGLS